MNAGVAKRVRCEAARVEAKEMSSSKQVSQQTRHDQNDTPSKSRRDRFSELPELQSGLDARRAERNAADSPL